MGAILLLAMAAFPDRLEDAYIRSLDRLAKANRLYVKAENGLEREVMEYWLQKPNRFRIRRNGKVLSVCDGKTRWDLESDGRKGKRAEKGFPPEIVLFGFEPFLRKGGVPGDYQGAGEFTFRRAKTPSINVKTTESAVMYGTTYFDRKTLLPLGHTLFEYAELVVQTRYLKVSVNPKYPSRLFREPRKS